MVHWHNLHAQEYLDPKRMPVWATDGATVFRATWVWEPPDQRLEEGVWFNEKGEPTKVVSWAILEDSPDGPPEVPDLKSYFKQKIKDDDSDPANWWKQ
jgi:hypothetical protein